jgi:hypothetical protein
MRLSQIAPWQLVHKCDCSRCGEDGATAQDNYVERELYKHMNRHRTLQDEAFEGVGPYTVGHFTDVRRMFEAYLGLRTVAHPHHPLPGLGLCVLDKCVNCGITTRPPGMLEIQATGIGKPFPGMPKTCNTQQLLDQTIGKCSLLDHLPEDKATLLRSVPRWGTRCPAQCTKSNNVHTWADTMLPSGLDSQQPLPPLLRVTKGLYSSRLSAVLDTLTMTHNGRNVTYKLLACVYGNTRHFTACIRYHIDEGNEQFFHFDPFHFETDRLLPLSDHLPACMGGKPDFKPYHTAHMKESFFKHTHLRNVATAIYGIVAAPQPDQDIDSDADEEKVDDKAAEQALPANMHDCLQCAAEKESQLYLWTCEFCTYDNALTDNVCVMCATNQPAAPTPSTSVPSWTCPRCTYINPLTSDLCALCTTQRPAPVWTCPSCTYDNPMTKDLCSICARDPSTAPMSASASPSTSSLP